jgi:hypothetical protein
MKINRRHFRIALTAAGTSIKGFARAYGCSEVYAHLILGGKRRSKGYRVERAMQEIIDKEFSRLKFYRQYKTAA